MNIRPTQSSNFELVKAGIAFNFAKLVKTQEQLSSGKRIVRPSDDPIGTAAALALKRQLADIARHKHTIGASKPLVDASVAALDDAGTLLSEARALTLQGLNGTLNDQDRATLANQLELLKQHLLELGNTQFGEQYVFGGSETGAQPFVDAAHDKTAYAGDDKTPIVPIGNDEKLAIGVAGSNAFAKFEPTGTTFGGLTGAAVGRSADQGSGYVYLDVRHDATSGTLGAGVTLVASGTNDTLLGDATLTIDGAAGTVQLGNGPIVHVPTSGSANASDFTVTDENGAVVHLDFSAYTGGDLATTLSGAGSISLDGTNYVALDFAAIDLELGDPATGTILHVDTTGIRRAGHELVTFSGTVNAFDALQGIIDDLENVHGLSSDELLERLSSRLEELDRNFDNVELAQSVLGAASARLTSADARMDELDLSAQSLLSNVEDVDLGTAILEMTRADQTLQAAQQTGARLIQNSLLNYLR